MFNKSTFYSRLSIPIAHTDLKTWVYCFSHSLSVTYFLQGGGLSLV